uniref:Uncharacterized protein n=1 Tax=Solanum tuberosum TaxID=4113 RepID=M1D736_SOLTU
MLVGLTIWYTREIGSYQLKNITQKALRWPLEQSVAQDSIFKRNLESSLQLKLTRFRGNRYHVDCKGTEKHASYKIKIKVI